MCGRGAGNVDNQLAPHRMSGQRREASGEHQRVLLGRAENSSEGGQRGTCARRLGLGIQVCRFGGRERYHLTWLLASHHLARF